MEEQRLLYLSKKDVAETGLTMPEVIEAVEQAFLEKGEGRVEMPPKPGVHSRPNSFIHAMPAYIAATGALGLKWVAGYPDNSRKGLPYISGLLVLNDAETGLPMAVMDCVWITAMRTGAVSAVAARYLATKNSAIVGIIGAGIQGRYNLLALAAAMPALESARVFDINPRTSEDFIAAFAGELELQFENSQSPQAVIEGADIIVTATGRLDQPIFKEKWISPGALVLPVHHRGWENRTLHRVDKFITDDWQQLKLAHETVGGFDGPLPQRHAELGKIIIGQKPGRENEKERIIDFNYGLAIEDVAMANQIYMRAKVKGLGRILPLIKDELPYA